MTSESIPLKRKLNVRTKLAYASGSLEDAMVLAAGAVTMVYYNQALGVSATLCGWAFLIGSVVDAISDPLVGYFSDQLRSRWGRRHPFMFFSAVPLGLSFFLLYQPPSGLSETQLFYWLAATYVGVHLSKSFYSVPHTALGAELTSDYDERTSLFGWNWAVYYIAGAALGYIVLHVIFPSTEGFENGLLNLEQYRVLAVAGGLFVFAMVLFCTFATADQIPYLHAARAAGDKQRSSLPGSENSYSKNIWILAKNLSYISVCGCWLVLYISGGVLAVVSIYTLLYAFELTTEELAWRAVITVPGAAIGVLLSRWLVRRFDKKNTLIGTALICSFLVGLPYCLRLLGWFPENGSEWLVPAILGIWTAGYLFLPVVPIVIDSQLGDIADEHELMTGDRAEGIIYSVRTFGMKMTRGLGTALGGMALDFIGFPDNAAAETLEPEVVNGLLWMTGPLYIFIVWGGLGFAFLYRIDRKRHAEILEQLELRRAQSTEP